MLAPGSRSLALMALVLLTAAADAGTPADDAALFAAVNKDSARNIRLALEVGADVDAQSVASNHMTPLMLAVQKGQGNAIPILLEHGADTEKATPDGFTAMHIAAFHGEWGGVQLLINHGVDPDKPNELDGYTPIYRACWGEEQHHTDTVAVLLHAGVNFDTAMGKDGLMPIQMTKRPQTREALILAKQRADPDVSTRPAGPHRLPAAHAALCLASRSLSVSLSAARSPVELSTPLVCSSFRRRSPRAGKRRGGRRRRRRRCWRRSGGRPRNPRARRRRDPARIPMRSAIEPTCD